MTLRWKVLLAIILPLWVFVGFFSARIVAELLLRGLATVGIDFFSLNAALQQTTYAAIVYILAIMIVVGLPWLVLKRRTSKAELGLRNLPTWKDLGITPIAFIAYFILSAVLLVVAQSFLPFVDLQQVQETGFSGVSSQMELVLAFVALVVIAPFAEEILFRGYLFGKLRKAVPLWLAIVLTSLVFGYVHGQWNVGIDTFALSVVMCLAVVWAKNLWPAIFVHVLKNGIAFYFLFINPIV